MLRGRLFCSQLQELAEIQTHLRNLSMSLIPSKNEDPVKNTVARVATRFLPLYVYGDFSKCSKAANSTEQDPIWPNFKLSRHCMIVLITCKNQVPREVLKTSGFAHSFQHFPLVLANVNKWKIMFDPSIVI